MPDPLMYLQAMSASLVASAIGALVISWVLSRANSSNRRIASILGMGFGLAIGFLLLRFRLVWPPANGLDRFLTIILPAAFVIEITAASLRVAPGLSRFMRIVLIATSGRILLHGSIYLSPSESEWTRWQLAVVLVLNAALLASVWKLMVWLSERSADASIPLSIAMTILSAGVLVMLAGYLKGGAAAFPLAAAFLGSAVASLWFCHGADLRGAIGIGIMGLFSVLFIGRFFGGLTTGTAVIVLLAPLLCWVTELPGLRQRKPWQILAFRLVLVAIPLFVVLANAKSDFDREMGPLLTRWLREMEYGSWVHAADVCAMTNS